MNFKGISVYMIKINVVIFKNIANLNESWINGRLLMHAFSYHAIMQMTFRFKKY